jgi:hypothetical protein
MSGYSNFMRENAVFFTLYFFLPYLNQVFLKSSAADVIQHLSGPGLVRVIHTKDGSRLGILCVKHGNAKVRHSWPRSFILIYDQFYSTNFIFNPLMALLLNPIFFAGAKENY